MHQACSDLPPRKGTKAIITVSDIAFDLLDQGCMLVVICDMLDRYNANIESSWSDMNKADVDTASLKDKIDELLRHVKSFQNRLNTIEGQTIRRH